MIAVKSDERLNDPICVAFFHSLAAYKVKLLRDVPIVLMNNNNPTYIKILRKKTAAVSRILCARLYGGLQ